MAQHARGIAGNYRSRRNVPGDHASGTYGGSFSNGDSTKDCRCGTDRGATLDSCRNALPIRLGLQSTRRVGGTRKTIIDESYVVPNKDFFL